MQFDTIVATWGRVLAGSLYTFLVAFTVAG
jgi:hypothetical protein